MEELDSEQTLEELNEVLNYLTSGEAPEKDSIPAEVLKCSRAAILIYLSNIMLWPPVILSCGYAAVCKTSDES